jgi:hypothetical protein
MLCLRVESSRRELLDNMIAFGMGTEVVSAGAFAITEVGN